MISKSCKSILEKLKFNIFENNSIKSNRIKSGVLLTGGSSELVELEGLARKIFHLPVKKGLINRNLVRGDEKVITNSEFSTSIGLLLCKRDEGGLEPIKPSIKKEKFGSKMKDLFKKF